MGKVLELEGLKYNKLTVLKQVDDYISPSGRHSSQWLCLCECGNYTVVRGTYIKNGKIKSCGCVLQEHLKKLNASKKGHIQKPNNYDLSGDYGIGYTSKGEKFYFDLEDYDKVKKIHWCTGTGGYIVGRIPGENRNIEMQRYIMGITEHDVCVDHIITENKNDNRKQNLRIVTKSENNRNHKVRKDNKSGVTGVNKTKNGKKWKAEIRSNNKVIRLGYFENKEDAIKARKEAEIKYFGELRYRSNNL